MTELPPRKLLETKLDDAVQLAAANWWTTVLTGLFGAESREIMGRNREKGLKKVEYQAGESGDV